MARAFPDVKDQELRSHLGSFGVGGTLALQALYTLSGGQKSRVAFAKVRAGAGAAWRAVPLSLSLAARLYAVAAALLLAVCIRSILQILNPSPIPNRPPPSSNNPSQPK